MDCRKVKRLLVSFLEGELSGRRREDFEAHLKICASCQKELDVFSESWQMLEEYVVPPLKDDFAPSLMRRIHSEQAEIVKVTYRLPRFVFRPLVPALVSILVLVLVVSLFWEKLLEEKRLVKVTPSESGKIATLVSEKEIIQNLDILENVELLQNMNLVKDIDTIENFGAENS